MDPFTYLPTYTYCEYCDARRIRVLTHDPVGAPHHQSFRVRAWNRIVRNVVVSPEGKNVILYGDPAPSILKHATQCPTCLARIDPSAVEYFANISINHRPWDPVSSSLRFLFLVTAAWWTPFRPPVDLGMHDACLSHYGPIRPSFYWRIYISLTSLPSQVMQSRYSN